MTRLHRPTARHPAVMKHRDHARLWRLVEGGVVDAFQCHPTYLTAAGRHAAVQSITKRVVGQIVGHAKQAQGAVAKGKVRGGSGGGAVYSGGPQGAGRAATLPRTRNLALYATLMGGAHGR